MEETSIEITICMGSSCFARGNKKTLEAIQGFLRETGLSSRISLAGSHCLGKCVNGPVIKINNTFYTNVDESNVVGYIEAYLEMHRNM